MSATVLITNFNYAQFIETSLKSAVNQTYAPCRILVVDDGSTDNSVDIIERFRRKYPEISLIRKKNFGQLSCFNAAIPELGNSDWIFFLDADDYLQPDHIQSMIGAASKDTSVLLASIQEFQNPTISTQGNPQSTDNVRFIDVPQSAHIARSLGKSIGRPTSGVAIRAALYRRIFPYYPEEDWKISADQVIHRGSSILGAKKRFVTNVYFGYRVHGDNLWHGRRSQEEKANRRAAIRRLNFEMSKRTGGIVPIKPDFISWPALREIRSVPRKYREHLNVPSLFYFALSILGWAVRKNRI